MLLFSRAPFCFIVVFETFNNAKTALMLSFTSLLFEERLESFFRSYEISLRLAAKRVLSLVERLAALLKIESANAIYVVASEFESRVSLYTLRL